MNRLMKRLTNNLRDKERPLKIFLLDLKEWVYNQGNLQLYLKRIKNEENITTWVVEAYENNGQGNTIKYPINCCLDKNANIHTVLSLLADTGYEIHVSKEIIPVHSCKV